MFEVSVVSAALLCDVKNNCTRSYLTLCPTSVILLFQIYFSFVTPGSLHIISSSTDKNPELKGGSCSFELYFLCLSDRIDLRKQRGYWKLKSQTLVRLIMKARLWVFDINIVFKENVLLIKTVSLCIQSSKSYLTNQHHISSYKYQPMQTIVCDHHV